MESEISKVLNKLFENLEKETDDLNECYYGKFVENLKNYPYDFNNPDVFNSLVMSRIESVSQYVAKNIMEEKTDNSSDMDKLVFLYTNYDFLIHNIRALIGSKSGLSCVGDQVNFILDCYRYMLLGKNNNHSDFENESYSHPKFGTYESWMNFCNGLYELYYGRPNNYRITYDILYQSPIRQFKHIQHDWFFNLKHQSDKKYLLETTFDDDIRNPLEKTSEDYILISKKNLGSDCDIFEKSKSFPFLRKISKENIGLVWKISKEVYL